MSRKHVNWVEWTFHTNLLARVGNRNHASFHSLIIYLRRICHISYSYEVNYGPDRMEDHHENPEEIFDEMMCGCGVLRVTCSGNGVEWIMIQQLSVKIEEFPWEDLKKIEGTSEEITTFQWGVLQNRRVPQTWDSVIHQRPKWDTPQQPLILN